jgi:integrase
MTTQKASSGRRRIPSMCLHKATGQSVVRLNGKDVYCGVHGTQEAQEKYERAVAEWLLTNQPAPLSVEAENQAGHHDITVNELVLAYWSRHVTTYFVKREKPTSEQDNIRQALRFVRRLYGTTSAARFGPLALKAVRQSMIDANRCRALVNKDVGRVRGMFKWAVGNELLPGAVHQALLTVPGLAKGRNAGVREAEPVTPAPEQHVWAVHAAAPPAIQAMIELQWWTGMRPGEVVLMRGRDIDRGSDVWVYTPDSHKREHHGLQRPIAIGPRAQAVLAPWMEARPPGEYLFSPKDSMAARKITRKMIRPRDHYRVSSYRNVIRRACDRLGIPVWFPNQLRHNAGTRVRQRFGLEASRAVLGHESVDTTLIYAEKDRDEARRIMREVG